MKGQWRSMNGQWRSMKGKMSEKNLLWDPDRNVPHAPKPIMHLVQFQLFSILNTWLSKVGSSHALDPSLPQGLFALPKPLYQMQQTWGQRFYSQKFIQKSKMHTDFFHHFYQALCYFSISKSHINAANTIYFRGTGIKIYITILLLLPKTKTYWNPGTPDASHTAPLTGASRLRRFFTFLRFFANWPDHPCSQYIFSGTNPKKWLAI